MEETPAPENPNAVKWDENGAQAARMQEAVMRVKTGIYDRELTPEDLEKVTELGADGIAFSSLDWLSYLKGLTVLLVSTDTNTKYIWKGVMVESRYSALYFRLRRYSG